MKVMLKSMAGNNYQRLRVARQLARAFKAGFGQTSRICPICNYAGLFLAEVHFPDIFNFDALCPSCGSLPRNRLIWLAIRDLGMIGEHSRVLHFAPEACLRAHIKALTSEYVTADLYASGVDKRLDITAISEPDVSYDVVIASHVLEHVDDKKAIVELYRIIRPGGLLLILVPVAEGWESTYEDKSIVSPNERATHYGKDNHVRRYGRDLRVRLGEPGFSVIPHSYNGALSVEFGLLPGENLYICSKPDF